MRIHTVLVHNASGRAQIKATAAGRQRTVSYDHALSPERNHGLAAGELALVLVQGETARRLAAETARHIVKGARHTFTFGE